MFRTTLASWVLAVFGIATAWPQAALAQKRVALVVGNGAYHYTSALKNPRNDASDIASQLRMRAFEVLEGYDLDKEAFGRKLQEFSAALKGAEAGVFFYAGHGLQVAGQNYLVPVDAKAESEDALDWEMFKVELVHRAMERSTNTSVLFLDACRDNPLARNLARNMGTRSGYVGRGLAPIESGIGTLISFSTQPGNVALDGSGRNSPFAGALVKQISSSTDDLSAILIEVRNEVMKATERRQVPWEHSALTGRFYFGADIKKQPAAKTKTKVISSVPDGSNQLAKDDKSVSVALADSNQASAKPPIPSRTPAVRRLTGHKAGVFGVALSPDNKLAMSHTQFEVRIWSVETGVELGRVTAEGPTIEAAALFKSGANFVVADARTHTFEVFDTATRRSLRTAPAACQVRTIRAPVRSTSALIPGCGGLWDLETLSLQKRVKVDGSRRAVVSNDALSVAIWEANEEIHVWDMTRDERRFILPGHDQGKGIAAVAISGDGKMALSGARVGEFKIWDLQDGRERGVYRLGNTPIMALAFSPDNKFALVGYYDLSKWDLAKGREIAVLAAQDSSAHITALAISEDGKLAIGGDNSGRISIWKTD